MGKDFKLSPDDLEEIWKALDYWESMLRRQRIDAKKSGDTTMGNYMAADIRRVYRLKRRIMDREVALGKLGIKPKLNILERWFPPA